VDALARLQSRQQRFESGQFRELLIARRLWLLDLLLELLNPPRDKLHVGQQEIFVEPPHVARGISSAKGRDHQNQATRLANMSQLRGVPFVRPR